MFEIIHSAILGINRVIIGDVVAMISWGGIDRHEPEAANAQVMQIVQFFGNTVKVADAVAVTITERTDEDLIENCVVPPGKTICACNSGRGRSLWQLDSRWSCPAATGQNRKEQEYRRDF